MYDREELAWAAGLFDGEGTCSNRNSSGGPGVRLSVRMSDQEAVDRFARALRLDSSAHGAVLDRARPYKSRPKRIVNEDGRIYEYESKPMWWWEIGNFEGVQYVLAVLWPWLGSTKREQIAAVLRRAGVGYGRNRLVEVVR